MTVEWHGDDLVEEIRRASLIGVIRGAEMVSEEAVRLIESPPKTGHVYRRRGVEHQASAPGEAPAKDTGDLDGSAQVNFDEATLVARVNFGVLHAGALEFGTETIEPRPFARPALEAKRDDAVDAVREEVEAALR